MVCEMQRVKCKGPWSIFAEPVLTSKFQISSVKFATSSMFVLRSIAEAANHVVSLTQTSLTSRVRKRPRSSWRRRLSTVASSRSTSALELPGPSELRFLECCTDLAASFTEPILCLHARRCEEWLVAIALAFDRKGQMERAISAHTERGHLECTKHRLEIRLL